MFKDEAPSQWDQFLKEIICSAEYQPVARISIAFQYMGDAYTFIQLHSQLTTFIAAVLYPVFHICGWIVHILRCMGSSPHFSTMFAKGKQILRNHGFFPGRRYPAKLDSTLKGNNLLITIKILRAYPIENGEWGRGGWGKNEYDRVASPAWVPTHISTFATCTQYILLVANTALVTPIQPTRLTITIAVAINRRNRV